MSIVRPINPHKNRSVRFTFRCSPVLLARLDAVAKESRQSTGLLVRRILADYVRALDSDGNADLGDE